MSELMTVDPREYAHPDTFLAALHGDTLAAIAGHIAKLRPGTGDTSEKRAAFRSCIRELAKGLLAYAEASSDADAASYVNPLAPKRVHPTNKPNWA